MKSVIKHVKGERYVQVEMRALGAKIGVKKRHPARHAKRVVVLKDYIQLPLFPYMISGRAGTST